VVLEEVVDLIMVLLVEAEVMVEQEVVGAAVEQVQLLLLQLL